MGGAGSQLVSYSWIDSGNEVLVLCSALLTTAAAAQDKVVEEIAEVWFGLNSSNGMAWISI